jgi:hypothetical protein
VYRLPEDGVLLKHVGVNKELYCYVVPYQLCICLFCKGIILSQCTVLIRLKQNSLFFLRSQQIVQEIIVGKI